MTCGGFNRADVCERFMTATKQLLIRLANDASGTIVRRLADVPR